MKIEKRIVNGVEFTVETYENGTQVFCGEPVSNEEIVTSQPPSISRERLDELEAIAAIYENQEAQKERDLSIMDAIATMYEILEGGKVDG